MRSSITYKGYKSPTLHVVFLGFFTGTGLLIAGYIDMRVWEVSVLGLLTAYVVAGGMSKGAEAYVSARVPESVAPPAPGPVP